MLTTARLRRAGWLTMTITATGLALFSARYFSLNPAVFLANQVAVYVGHLAPLLLHVGGGVTALAVGPWQFWGALRSRHPAVHRAMGRVYLAAAAAAAAGGLLLAPVSLGGPLAYAVGAWTSWMIDLLAAQVLLTASSARPTGRRAIR